MGLTDPLNQVSEVNDSSIEAKPVSNTPSKHPRLVKII